MLNYQPLSTPQYYFYFLYTETQPVNHLPNNNQVLIQTLPNQEQQLPKFDNYEKIMVTSQDLKKQGYEPAKKSWTQEEDRLLLRLCKNQNTRFEEIASSIEGRNPKMCYSRYRRLVCQTKNNWSKSQNEELITLVIQYGEEDWKRISTLLSGRTHKQIKDHYFNYLKVDYNRTDWTLEEDLQLIKLINLLGKNWKGVNDQLTGRTKDQIKNRFFGKITRLNNKKKNLSMEDAILNNPNATA